MFKYNNKKNILSIFLLASTFLVVQNTCDAAYDVVKAKTIRPTIQQSPLDMDSNYEIYDSEDDFIESESSSVEELPF